MTKNTQSRLQLAFHKYNFSLCCVVCVWGVTVGKWVAPMPHSKNIAGSSPSLGNFCVEFACSTLILRGFRLGSRLPAYITCARIFTKAVHSLTQRTEDCSLAPISSLISRQPPHVVTIWNYSQLCRARFPRIRFKNVIFFDSLCELRNQTILISPWTCL